MPWFAVHGNHDNMLQGTVPAAGWLAGLPVGGVKYVTPPADLDAARALYRFDAAAPDALAELGDSTAISVTPDPRRAPVTRSVHVREHFRTSGTPAGHGYSQRNVDDGNRLLRVRPRGGALRRARHGQSAWRLAGLARRDPARLAARRAGGVPGPPGSSCSAIIRSRRWSTTGARPVPTAGSSPTSCAAFLLEQPSVVAWVNGHTHIHAVTAVHQDGAPGGFWQITTASHIDWPQQARLIEVLRADGLLVLGCTVVDTDAPASYGGLDDPADPAGMASLARELAANDWQVREAITADGGAGAGTADDRNVILLVDWPRAASAVSQRQPQSRRSRRPVQGVAQRRPSSGSRPEIVSSTCGAPACLQLLPAA